jgi:hypothetical protein
MSDQPTQENQSTETKEVASTEFRSDAFDEMLKRMTGSAAAGTQPKTFRYRQIDVVIPLEGLRPETYDAPIKLTLQELSSEGEMRAFRATGARSEEGGLGAINQPQTDAVGSSMMMAHAMAREALHSINGRLLVDDYEKNIVWNSMTTKARVKLAEVFFESGTGDDVEGKIEGSLVVI